MFVVEQDKLRQTNQAIFNGRTSLAVLSEVLNGTNHLRSVRVLVVVPRHDLDLVGVVVDLSNHGLGSVEQRAVTHADDVGRNDLILVVAEGLRGSSLHSSVDGLNGNVLTLDNGNQDGGRTGGNGHTLSRADQLAVQLGDDQADGLGSAGGVRNDVLGTSTSAAQVALALRAVQDHLVAGVSMNGGHDAGDDGIGLVQGVGHGGQAVGGAGGVGDHVHLRGVPLVVHSHDKGGRDVVLGRGGDDDLFRPVPEVGGGLFRGAVGARGLDDVLGAAVVPGDVGGVVLTVNPDLLAVDNQVTVVPLHRALKGLEHGVVLHLIDHVVQVRVPQVDAAHLIGGAAALHHDPQCHAADPAKSVDSHFDRHAPIPSCIPYSAAADVVLIIPYYRKMSPQFCVKLRI